jgi:hypothetical protein
MNTDDKVIALRVRHAFAKSPLDITELIVSCHNGCIEMNGIVKRPRNYPGAKELNLNREVETLKQLARNTAGVKSLYADKIRIRD